MEPHSLTTLIDEQLTAARADDSRCTVTTLHAGAHLHQVLVVLAEDGRLPDHTPPGDTTLFLVRGSITFSTQGASVELTEGDLMDLPDELHNVAAHTDSAFILSFAPRG